MSKQNFEELVLQKLTNIEGDISGMKGDISDLKMRTTNIETDISVMKGDIVSMKGDIDTMKGDIVSMKGDIDTMKGDIVSMKGDIDTMKGDIHDLKIKSIIMDKKIDGLYSKNDDLEGAIKLNSAYINQAFKQMSTPVFSTSKMFG